MKRVFAIAAFALAIFAAPLASMAQNANRAGIGVAINNERNRLTVAAVMPGGTGDLMGVRAGDVITHAGGRRITTQLRFAAYIRSLNPGDAVALTVRRRGETLQLTGTAMARRW